MLALKSYIRAIFWTIISLLTIVACSDEPDSTTLLALEAAYLIRSQPTISCYFTGSDSIEYCIQNTSDASNLGSTCQFTPLLNHGARTVTNSSSTCEALGYTTCSTQPSGSGGATYQRCTK